MIKELQLLGMTKNEAIVYQALVKHGPCRAGLLITELDTHRNIIYEALESLILKSYAVKISERGVWRFQITDPNVLLTNLKRREEIAQNIISEIAAHSRQAARQITVYEGLESYRRYWITSIERVPVGTIDYVAGAGVEPWATFMGKSIETYFRLCEAKKVVWKQLYFGITQQERRRLRAVPVDQEARVWKSPIPRPFQGNFNVIHDTVILHTMQSPPRIVEIRDEAIVSMFRNYFDIMWSQAEPVG
ncbi:MAG: helix-turn-helix domain-containing protein [Alphaproteobacteria bacterium]